MLKPADSESACCMTPATLILENSSKLELTWREKLNALQSRIRRIARLIEHPTVKRSSFARDLA